MTMSAARALMVAVALAFSLIPASANSITFQGVTFSLTDMGAGELEVRISGASTATGDWAGIKYLEAFALKPAGGTYTSASLAGWTSSDSGLNNNGCSKGGAGYICFYQPTLPVSIPALGDMVFDVFFTGGTVDFDPTHLKVNFLKDTKLDRQGHFHTIGSLLSQDIPVSSVPGPVVGVGLPGLMTAIGLLFAFFHRRRNAVHRLRTSNI